jgi:septum site-determining protein MinD
MATEYADRIIVVTTPQVTSMHDADCVISLLKKYNERELSLLVNCFSRQMVKSGNQIDICDIRELLETDILGVVFSDENIIIAQNQGIPLYEDDAPAAYCYRRIVRRIIGDNVPIPERSLQRRRFFWRGRCYNEV